MLIGVHDARPIHFGAVAIAPLVSQGESPNGAAMFIASLREG
jgi:hypothetical protein